LAADGRLVTPALLQRKSGLAAFSKNANRSKAIAKVIQRYKLDDDQRPGHTRGAAAASALTRRRDNKKTSERLAFCFFF